MTTAVDHLVVAARTLDDGVQWCEAKLGATPGPGGRHPLMGTHNRLLNVGSATFPQVFLEIIAIDPAAQSPGRPRWFGLDELDLKGAPRLLHFVARSGAISVQRLALQAAGFDVGPLIAASRDTPQGRLEWQLSVRDDGCLLARGALPTLIDWGRTPHPTNSMANPDVVLQRLTLRGLALHAVRALDLQSVEAVSGQGPALSAVLDTPRGRVTLDSM